MAGIRLGFVGSATAVADENVFVESQEGRMIPIYRAFAYPVKLVVYRETWDHIGTVKEITFHTTPRREMIRALRAVEAAIASHPQLKVTLNDALGRAMLDE